jgi:hypothetical protein
VVSVRDQDGAELERATFRVNCQTELHEPNGKFQHLLHMLKYTLHGVATVGALDATRSREPVAVPAAAGGKRLRAHVHSRRLPDLAGYR